MDAALNIAVIICAAGASSRMKTEGLPVKKEYQKLNNGNTVLGTAVCAFAGIPSVRIIVIAVPENGENAARATLPANILSAQRPKILFVTGGSTRRHSVFNALSVLADFNPGYVLIHDGARPWVSASLIENIITAVKKYNAVIPLLPLTDTPKECESQWELQTDNGMSAIFIKNHLKRKNTGVAQTPQAFKFPEILHAHKQAASVETEEFTDDAEIWGRFCGSVAVIPGDPENRKITFPEDLI
ncbi:MAG: 2-C-methyl-D-erythritol 4-phosphate cytidylyltransferase [Treponema sp.]|jgi:2-C-methyl-D-erythritol 4-phosphate cytidylyltransferase|nr:2-C-methyl-D-erythritol 4-phosphate cytidylyltransferase [Treponema sp.]